MRNAIALVNVGQKYKQYTEVMRSMLSRHVTVDHDVVLLGDEATSPLQGWWAKLKIFDPAVFKDYDNVLYMDINHVICGNIDDLILLDVPFAAAWGFRPGTPLRNQNIPIGVNSGTMKWKPKTGITDRVWEEWNERPFVTCHGDQQFIGDAMVGNITVIQEKLPGYLASFKDDYYDDESNDYRILYFHGYPKPHDIPDNVFVKEHWR